MSRLALKLLDGIYGLIISSIIMTSSIFAVYSIWDNNQVYQAAENVQDEIRKLKPIETEEKEGDKGAGFDELQKVNSDVVGWITVDNTNIDYPVLQGDTNLTYMDKDIYGEFSLAGSIFLDIRNNPDFSDNYSLIYGHNMDEHLMFGDISLFKKYDFFKENTSAELIIPGENIDLGVVAVLQISAGTEEIFNPNRWSESLEGLAEFLEKYSIYYHKKWTELMKADPDKYQIVTLVTCSSGSTNDRSVLVLIRTKKGDKEPGEDPPIDEPTTEEDTTEETTEEDITEEESTPGEITTEASAEESVSSVESREDASTEETSAASSEESITEAATIIIIPDTTEESTSSGPTKPDGDDIGEGEESSPAGDSTNINFWKYLTIGSFLFIVLFEGFDKIRRKDEE